MMRSKTKIKSSKKRGSRKLKIIQKRGEITIKIHYIQNDSQVGLGKIENWAVQRKHILTSTKVYEKCNFPSLDEFDFLIILGGHMGAYEEETYSWLSLVKQFIKEAVNHNKYVLGICLGAQLIANALGGKVYPHTHKEVGWWPIEINKDASNVQILSGIADKFTALQFHGDTFDIPKDAVLLGSSKGCKNQLFIYGDRVIGIQFHPELTNELIEKALKTYEYSKGFKGFMQKPEDIINQFTFLDQSTDMLFTLLDNIQNKFKENIENTPLC